MRRRAIFVLPEGSCPHPRHSYGRRVYLEDSADNGAIGEHVVIGFIPLAGGAAR
jgi:hypothetical protein